MGCEQGGRPVQTAPHSRTPKVFEPIFLQFECWGKLLAPARNSFWPPEGEKFFSPYVSILEILRILWRIQKWVKNTKKKIDPQPNLMLMAEFFFEKKFYSTCVCSK